MVQEKLEEQVNIPLLAFFPAKLLSITLYSLIFITAMFVALWPWGKDLTYFLRLHQSPSLAFPIFTATVILYSYIQLRLGRGELLQKERDIRYFSSILLQKREQAFSHYGPPMLLLHTIFFLLPFSPLLILAASVSELSLQALLAACGLIWMSGVLFRVAGLLLYRLWGTASTLGYFLGRVFFGLSLFLVPVYLPQLSLLRVLHALCKNAPLVDGRIPLYTGYWLCLGAMGLTAIVMFFITRFPGERIEQKKAKE